MSVINSLSQRTIAAVIWNAIERVSKLGLGFVVTLVLAGLLMPSDMGLVAMGGVFIVVGANLATAGFAEALIRKKNAHDIDFDTTFWTNIGFGLVVYLLIYAAAPVISRFYNQPELVAIVRVSGLSVIVAAFQAVQTAVLRKRLEFRRLVAVTVPAGLVSGAVSILLAYLGFGYWALVIQALLYSGIGAALLWRSSSWRPALRFSSSSFRELFGFGSRMMAISILGSIAANVVVVLVAKMFSETVAGLYVFANRIFQVLVIQVSHTVQAVTYPALASIQDDEDRLYLAYRKIVRLVTFVTYPMLIITVVNAPPIFDAILPQRWGGSVIILQLLCFSGIPMTTNFVISNVLRVKGKANLLLLLEIGSWTSLVFFVIVGSQFGLIGILASQIVHATLACIPTVIVSSRIIDYRVRDQFADVLPALGLSVASGVVGIAAKLALPLSPLAALPIVVGLMIGAYLGIAKVLGVGALKFLVARFQDLRPERRYSLWPRL